MTLRELLQGDDEGGARLHRSFATKGRWFEHQEVIVNNRKPGASLITRLVKNPPAMQRPQFDTWVRKIRWRRDRLPTPVFLGFPYGHSVRLYFFGLQNHCKGDCSHKIKRRLFLGRKVMTNLDSILKSRDITLPTKVHLVKAMVFPVVMYGCESWTVKKAEHQKIDAFELWCWRRLLRVPWTARRANQSILKEISPGCSLEGLMLKLKLQYFGHLIRRADSLEKTLVLGGIVGRRRRG